MLVLQPLKL